MPNQITFGANISPPNTPMEVSINSGASFVTLAFTTVGANQQGILTNVPAATYAINQLVQRAIGYAGTTTFTNQQPVIVGGTAATPAPSSTTTPTVTATSATPA